MLEAYNQITPNVNLSGPTNFAPLIHQAIDIVKRTKQVCSRVSIYTILENCLLKLKKKNEW